MCRAEGWKEFVYCLQNQPVMRLLGWAVLCELEQKGGHIREIENRPISRNENCGKIALETVSFLTPSHPKFKLISWDLPDLVAKMSRYKTVSAIFEFLFRSEVMARFSWRSGQIRSDDAIFSLQVRIKEEQKIFREIADTVLFSNLSCLRSNINFKFEWTAGDLEQHLWSALEFPRFARALETGSFELKTDWSFRQRIYWALRKYILLLTKNANFLR